VEKLQRDFEQNHLIQWLEQAVVDTLTAKPVGMGGERIDCVHVL